MSHGHTYTHTSIQVPRWVHKQQNGGAPPLGVSKYEPRSPPPPPPPPPIFAHPPKIWRMSTFYSDLVGSHFEPPPPIFTPKIDQIYHFIQILLGGAPLLIFTWSAPGECPPPPHSIYPDLPWEKNNTLCKWKVAKSTIKFPDCIVDPWKYKMVPKKWKGGAAPL